MEHDLYNFEKIYIESKFKTHKNINKILSNIKSNPKIEYIDDVQKLIKNTPVVYRPDERANSLLLGGIRGEILQKCPGSHGHICCNYHVINLYIGCPINCTYCILQAYLNQPFTIINIDIESIFDNLKFVLTDNKDKYYRIGTGELGDSLVYDPITNFSKDFIEFFSNYKNAVFEFKTKTNFIENMINFNSTGNIVVGFSINPQAIIDTEEEYAASIIERLEAARQLIDKGYKISLHFDPIIKIDNFDNEYNKLIDIIFNYITSNHIAWISLGTFRYTPDLKNMIEYNYPDSLILKDEFLENADKKFRYFKPIRVDLYKKVIAWLKKKFTQETLHQPVIYLCMESTNVWNETIGNIEKSIITSY